MAIHDPRKKQIKRLLFAVAERFSGDASESVLTEIGDCAAAIDALMQSGNFQEVIARSDEALRDVENF